MDDAQLIDSPRERPALTFVQLADDSLRADGHATSAVRALSAHVAIGVGKHLPTDRY